MARLPFLNSSGTKGTNSIVARKEHGSNDGKEMQTTGKRTIQVNVKMSAEDFDNLQKAANLLWPDAILSNSGIILGLARLSAREVLKKKGRKTG